MTTAVYPGTFGVRHRTDALHEHQLAAMNDHLGVSTLLLPARPHLAAISSTAVRASRPAPHDS